MAAALTRCRRASLPFLGLLLASTAVAQPVPSVQEVEAAMQSGDTTRALQLVTRALAAPAQPGEERYNLLMIKGECLLKRGLTPSAATAFDAAVKAAGEDVRKAALARAFSLVAKKSPGNKYRPRQAGSQPIDIVDPESRKAAMDALYQDERARLRPKLAAAHDADTLPPIMAVMPAVLDLGALEGAVKGAATDTRTELQTLLDRGRGMMLRELRRLDARVDQVQNEVNGYTVVDGSAAQNGMTTPLARELRDTVNYLQQIQRTARLAYRRTRELHMDYHAWEEVLAAADDVADQIAALLGTAKNQNM